VLSGSAERRGDAWHSFVSRNNRSHWYAEGGTTRLPKVVRALEVDRFLLEYDDERSGTFEPLRLVPQGQKTVVLGLVSSRSRRMEDAECLQANRVSVEVTFPRNLR